MVAVSISGVDVTFLYFRSFHYTEKGGKFQAGALEMRGNRAVCADRRLVDRALLCRKKLPPKEQIAKGVLAKADGNVEQIY